MIVFLVFLLCLLTGLFVWYFASEYYEARQRKVATQNRIALNALAAQIEKLEAQLGKPTIFHNGDELRRETQ